MDGTEIEVDDEGCLLKTGDWSPELAEVIARGENMELTEDRLEIVHFVRRYFEERECIPELRTLLKELREKRGEEKATPGCSPTATASRPARSPACANR